MVLNETMYKKPQIFNFLQNTLTLPQRNTIMDIEALTQEAIGLLERMVSLPSVSREEKEVADLLENFMKERGKTPCRTGHNLWCISPFYRTGRPTLLLNAHIDTVKPAASWTRDPFRPTREGERIYGLGTNDDGASVVALWQAFCTLSGKEQPYNLIFLASCEEEVSGKNGIESVLPLLPHIDLALVGEPTGMQPAIAEKGLMVLDVTAHGKSGHAARNEGENAIYKAMKDMEWFRTYRFPKTSPLLGDVKMSVTVVHAGTQHNVVPDQCAFTVDVRSNENYSNEEIYRTACAHVGSEVKARSFRLNSSRIDENHPIVAKAKVLGRTPFRIAYALRPGADALPVFENGAGRILTFPHGGRIHHRNGNPGSHSLIHRAVGRPTDIKKDLRLRLKASQRPIQTSGFSF